MSPGRFRKSSVRVMGGTALATVLAVGAAFGQAFEVASVKPSDPRAGGMDSSKSGAGRGQGPAFQLEHRRLTVTRFNAFGLIVKAYGLTGCRPLGAGGCVLIAGEPDWTKKEGFDVRAKVPDSAPDYTMMQLQRGKAPEVQAMLQSLLAERFHLKAHREPRQLPIYAITLAKNGPKFRKSNSSDDSKLLFRPATQENGQEVIKLEVTNGSMAELAELYSKFFDRPVLDQTGLKDRYDFTVTYDANADEPGPFAALTGPALFRALQDQAGLKLEATKGTVPVLAIDHIERPGGN